MTDKLNSYMVTNSGLKVYANNPKKESFSIKDIAHSSSRIHRFNGHCDRMYTLAEHCIRGTLLLKKLGYGEVIQKAFFLHDASEVYLSDVVKPFKELLSDYMEIEKKVQDMIYTKYMGGILTEDEERVVKAIDKTMLFNEIRQLTVHPDKYDIPSEDEYHYVDLSITLSHDEAKRIFLSLAEELEVTD